MIIISISLGCLSNEQLEQFAKQHCVIPLSSFTIHVDPLCSSYLTIHYLHGPIGWKVLYNFSFKRVILNFRTFMQVHWKMKARKRTRNSERKCVCHSLVGRIVGAWFSSYYHMVFMFLLYDECFPMQFKCRSPKNSL